MSIPKAFVAGHPIAHSRSPMIHGYWLRAAWDCRARYERIDVAPQNFEAFFRGFAEQRLCAAATSPSRTRKRPSRRVDAATERAERLGAVNTLWLEDGRMLGDNTDVVGFVANLEQPGAGLGRRRSAPRSCSAPAARRGPSSRACSSAASRRSVVVNRTPANGRRSSRRFAPAPDRAGGVAR